MWTVAKERPTVLLIRGAVLQRHCPPVATHLVQYRILAAHVVSISVALVLMLLGSVRCISSEGLPRDRLGSEVGVISVMSKGVVEIGTGG